MVGVTEAIGARKDTSFMSRNPPPLSDLLVNKEIAFKSKNPFAAPNGNGNGNGQANRALIEALRNSRVYQDYERAFGEATGLPVALSPIESWQLPHHGRRFENAFCALLSQKSRACSACLQLQQGLLEKAMEGPCTVTCQVGKCDTAVPVKLGERVIGFLHTGQIFRKKPTETQFDRVYKLTSEWGVDVERRKLRDAYFSARVVPNREHESIVKLLSIFAQHLSMLSNQVVVQQGNSEPPVITKAKEYIHEHQTEEMSLGQVAKAVNAGRYPGEQKDAEKSRAILDGLGNCYYPMIDALDAPPASGHYERWVEGTNIAFGFVESPCGYVFEAPRALHEMFLYLLSGALEASVGGEKRRAEHGDVIHVPKGGAFQFEVSDAARYAIVRSTPRLEREVAEKGAADNWRG